jgi:hypothetical protein
VRLNFVFFTDPVSELYGQRMYSLCTRRPALIFCTHILSVLSRKVTFPAGQEDNTLHMLWRSVLVILSVS